MPQIVEFEGQRHEFPDDATDAEIAAALSGSAAQPTPVGRTPEFATSAEGQAPAPAAPSGLLRPLQIGAQGAGAGLAEAVSMPFDLVAGAQNALVSLVNRFVGTNIPMATPASSMLKNAASSAAESVGIQPIDKHDMNTREQLAYNINRFGAQAATAAPALAAGATARGADIAAGSAPRWFDSILRPYMGENIGRTVVGDAAAAAGSGAGVTAADYLGYEDNPLAQMLAATAGGIGGMTAAQVGERAVRAAGRAVGAPFGANIDKTINVDPKTNMPVTKSVSDRAARMVQDEAVNPVDAAARIRENTAELRRLTPDAPMPSPAKLSEDPGLAGLERQVNLHNQGPAIARNREFASKVRDTVDLVAPEGSNTSALLDRVRTRPEELAAARDAQALPLLRQAEASGAAVDAAPVATMIDEKLAQAKRPPVKNALTEARKMLNKAGTDQMDTSVSGLYETRKAINDIIEGRSDNPTGRYAQKELVEVRAELDKAIGKVSPEFDQYLTTYRAGSEPLNAVQDSQALKLVLESDPDKAVFAVMSQPHRSGKLLDELIKVTEGDPQARNGLKAAVRDYLVEKATSGASEKLAPGDRRGPVSQAKLSGIMREHEQEMARIFSPEEMNTLRAGHRALELANIERIRVSSGSDTAEKISLVNQFLDTGIGKGVEAALRIKYGMLKAGGVVATARRLTSGVTGGPSPDDVVRLVERAAVDPDLMGLLLGRKLPVASPAWNARMNQLLAAGEGARDTYTAEETAGDRLPYYQRK